MSKILLGIFVVFLLLIGGIFFLVNSLKNMYNKPLVETENSQSNSHNSQLNSQNFSDWKEYVPSSKRFKVMLPFTPPQYARNAIEIPNSDKKRRYEMYTSETVNGSLFMINVIT